MQVALQKKNKQMCPNSQSYTYIVPWTRDM